MRIALVQCPPWGSLPPLGLATLKAYLEERGHEAPCFDLNIDYCRDRLADLIDDLGGSVYARPDPWVSGSYEEWDFDFDGEVKFRSALKDRPLPYQRWASEILACAPRVVGFSLQSTNLGVTLQVAQEIARRDPSVVIVFGGPNVAEAQQGRMALLTGIPDVLVEGEGEETAIALLEAIESGAGLETVAGIGLLVDGKPVWTERRPLLKDINALPFPDFSDFDWMQYPNPYEIPVMASRGCVLKCAFCYETVYWKRYRTQSGPRVVAEILHQIERHPLNGERQFGIAFADSLVNGHLGGLRRMADSLIENGTNIYWNGQATINTKMDEDYIMALRRSGCTGLSFGLESGSPLVIESMGKRFDIDEAVGFFERVQRSGIELVVNVMVGFPTETRADFIETLRFLRRIRKLIHMVNNVGSTAIVGGSRLHQDPEQFGVQPLHPEWWADHINLEWTSEAAGDERNRQRRVRLLHAWMALMRIPHQKIGPSSAPRWRLRLPALARVKRSFGQRSASEAQEREKAQPPTPVVITMTEASVQRRLAKIARVAGVEPLVLELADGLLAPGGLLPAWSEPFAPEEWTGRSGMAIHDLIAARVQGTVRMSESRSSSQGVVDVALTIEGGDLDVTGFKIKTFPPLEPEGPQTVAIVPVVRTAASARG
ncbi:MAG: hypothetical protein JWO77_895 [Ilumatobacteraceae bacterium]|nr:hypothetical protein [Ilumatobacteraceae bacterium]